MITFVIILVFALIFIATLPSFGILSVFVVLAAALVLLMYKRNLDIKKNIYKVPEDALHITNLDKDGVIKLTGVGINKEEMTLKVIARHLYSQGDYSWYEYECDKGEGNKVWLEVEDDDETLVSVVLQELTLRSVGLTPNALVHFDDEEEGGFTYNKQRYAYSDSDSAVFYRYCDDKKPEKLYYWDFIAGDNTMLSVEKWGENEYKVYLCQKMLPYQITVYSTRGEGEV